KHNIGVLARVPFDEGSLTGRISEATTFPEGDFRNHYFRGDRKKQVAERVGMILNVLQIPDTSAIAEVALRFCLSNPIVSTVIPGMRSLSSVDANVKAATAGPLSS